MFNGIDVLCVICAFANADMMHTNLYVFELSSGELKTSFI